MKPFPKLTTQRLVLRGPMEKDIQPMFDIHTDPDVMLSLIHI